MEEEGSWDQIVPAWSGLSSIDKHLLCVILPAQTSYRTNTEQNDYFERNLQSVLFHKSVLGVAPHLRPSGAELPVPACWERWPGFILCPPRWAPHGDARKARPGGQKGPPGHGPERPAKENLPDTRGFLHPQVNFQLCNCEEASLAGLPGSWGSGGGLCCPSRRGCGEEGLEHQAGPGGRGLGAAGRCVVGDGSSRQGLLY